MGLSRRSKDDISAEFDGLKLQMALLMAQVESLRALVAENQLLNESQLSQISGSAETLATAVRLGLNDVALYRMELTKARNSQTYLDAYSQSEPLLTVVIPTHTAPPTLYERSLPSILQQSYERLEILLVVDGNFPGTLIQNLEMHRLNQLHNLSGSVQEMGRITTVPASPRVYG
jgi:hypothetical protein